VQYVPKINRFFWLQQLVGVAAVGEPGAYRLAMASPADIISTKGQVWTNWTLTPEVFGQIHTTQFDYPSMSVGTNYLYINWDTSCPKGDTPCNSGREVVRIPLTQLQAGGTIPIDYTSPAVSTMAWADDLTQNTGSEIFWAGHNGNSKLRVFSWPEGTGTYYWRDVGLTSYTPNADGCTTTSGVITPCPKSDDPHVSSFAPDPVVKGPVPVTQDWLFRNGDDSITGSTRSGSQLWFAWAAAPSGSIPQPYIVMVSINDTTFTKTQQMEVWNPGFAFGLPALSTNACTGEIGLSLAHGGAGLYYTNFAVGFWGDFVVYDATASNVTTGLYGDYVTIRQNNTADYHGAFFDGFGFGLTQLPSAGKGPILPQSQVDVGIQYVVFGRGGACTGRVP
jgi:hypothetical protein